ncbi:MAG: S-layer homology domain-containing protein, partial [Pseudoflavonifractor sp.]
VAVQRLRDGRNSLYRMDDALQISDAADTKPAKGAGLAGKHADVKVPAVTVPAATFPDVKAHASRTAIETLAARSILVGKDTGRFDPDATMTRAEFASAVVKALGLPPKAGEGFTDVPHDAWYAPVVGTAYAYGIVTGIDKTHFNPLGTITRQEAAVMVARAARLCGMDTALDAATARSVLAQFTDYTQSAQWARVPLAFCYRASIVPSAEGSILPTREIRRGEIAQMIFNLLGTANLL